MKRLGRHSAVYGLGGIVSRVLAVFLLPLYTRYLDRADLGAVGLVVALSAVLVTILRLGISSAFFRFYFDSTDVARRLLVVRTSFWFTMASATAETLREALRPLVADAARRRELGAASRAYVERVHDLERVADRLLDLYARL